MDDDEYIYFDPFIEMAYTYYINYSSEPQNFEFKETLEYIKSIPEVKEKKKK